MADHFSLENKTIIITGSTGVLGASFINAIAQAGGQLVLLGRNMEIAEARAHAVCTAGGKAIAIKADVLKENELSNACVQVLQTFGSIDGLVNAAGGNLPGAVIDPNANLFELNVSALQQVVELNLMGTVLPSMIFGKQMAQAKKGSIVNISSVSATQGLTRVLGYSLAKAGVEAFTRWMAVELAHRYGDGIRMNAMVPGFFLTEQNRQLLTTEEGAFTPRAQKIIQQTPFGRLGSPVELEGGLVWLLSDASKFVTGTTVTIDGGFSAYSGV